MRRITMVGPVVLSACLLLGCGTEEHLGSASQAVRHVAGYLAPCWLPPTLLVTPGCASNDIYVGSGQPTAQQLGEAAAQVDYLNGDLRHYGLMLLDAQNPQCAEMASRVLLKKLYHSIWEPAPGTMLHTDGLDREKLPFKGWLEGVTVSLIAAIALELGGQQRLTWQHDCMLQEVRDLYEFSIDDGCGPGPDTNVPYLSQVRNNCMDDYTQSAAGYAWIAAYEHMSGRPADTYAALAHSKLDLSLGTSTHMCLYPRPTEVMNNYAIVGHDPACQDPLFTESLPVPAVAQVCSEIPGITARLEDDSAEVASFNHDYQNMGYGIGLMTSISQAMLGLGLAGSPYTPGPEQHAVAMALAREGQRSAPSDGSSFELDCYRYDPSTGRLYVDADCGDAGKHYKPTMYPVANFYASKLDSLPETVTEYRVSRSAYAFDICDSTKFSNMAAFFHQGRYAIYCLMTDDWWTSPPSLSGYDGS